MEFKFPVEGGDFKSEDFIHIAYNKGINSVKVEMSATETFGRNRFIEDCAPGTWATATKAGDIKISSKNLTKDKLYYIRVQGRYNSSEGSKTTAWKTISAYYRGEGSGVEGVVNDNANVYITNENVLVLGVCAKQVAITNVGGQLVELINVENQSQLDINHLASGAYLIKVIGNEDSVVLKYVK